MSTLNLPRIRIPALIVAWAQKQEWVYECAAHLHTRLDIPSKDAITVAKDLYNQYGPHGENETPEVAALIQIQEWRQS